MSLDLTLNDNWSKILEGKKTVQYVKGDPSKKEYKYIPIPSFYTTPNSNVLLVGVQSDSAKKHWYLGARVNQYLYISPSASANFIQGVETSDQKRIKLSNLTLVNFKDYGIYPYVLAIEIPYWLEDVYVEVWEYNQVISDSVQQFNSEEILQRLGRIESKLNVPQIPATNYSTQFDNPDSSASLGII